MDRKEADDGLAPLDPGGVSDHHLTGDQVAREGDEQRVFQLAVDRQGLELVLALRREGRLPGRGYDVFAESLMIAAGLPSIPVQARVTSRPTGAPEDESNGHQPQVDEPMGRAGDQIHAMQRIEAPQTAGVELLVHDAVHDQQEDQDRGRGG